MQQRSEETRHRILQSAIRLFSNNGYDATSVADICQSAGVSKGAFYHHFPTKQAVFRSLLDDWLAGIDQQMDALRQTGQTVPENLVSMAGMLRGVFQDADQRLAMFLEFWTQSSRDPTLWQTTIDPYRRYQAFFAALVQQGIQEGSFRKVDPDMAARLIVSLAVGLLLQGLLDPHGADWVQVGQQGMQLLMDGFSTMRSE